jgi:hypothetical protein
LATSLSGRTTVWLHQRRLLAANPNHKTPNERPAFLVTSRTLFDLIDLYLLEPGSDASNAQPD